MHDSFRKSSNSLIRSRFLVRIDTSVLSMGFVRKSFAPTSSAFIFEAFIVERSYDDNGDGPGVGIFLQKPAYGIAIHLGHHDFQKDEIGFEGDGLEDRVPAVL